MLYKQYAQTIIKDARSLAFSNSSASTLLESTKNELSIQSSHCCNFYISLSFILFAVIVFYRHKNRKQKAELLKIRHEMISLEEALKKKSDQDNILNELLMEKLNTVRGIIRLNIQSSDSYDKFIKQYNKVFQCSITDILMWENLYPLFNKLHDNIGEKLNKFHPTLTEKELQLCCLIRAKFRQDEIAHILSYEYNSIKTIKMRLRMKLGFESNDSFIQFLHSL